MSELVSKPTAAQEAAGHRITPRRIRHVCTCSHTIMSAYNFLSRGAPSLQGQWQCVGADMKLLHAMPRPNRCVGDSVGARRAATQQAGFALGCHYTPVHFSV